MLSITAKEMKKLRPCEGYTLKRIEALWAGRDRLTALDILDLQIPAEDKLWGIFHEELIPPRQLWELTCQIAEAALNRERAAGREPDSRSWAAIAARRGWVRGEITNNELNAAFAAAFAVAREAYAAGSAAYVAAQVAYAMYDVAHEAAYAAARAVADATYGVASAADDVNYVSANEAHIILIRDFLLGEESE
jgi:hypothetical protein